MIAIKRTSETGKPSLVLTIYGQGGVGKSTLAATAPAPIFIDAEEGVKAFRARGIDVPVISVKTWDDVRQAWELIADKPEYQTVVIDPMDEFLNMLIEQVSGGGSMSLPKWGEAKNVMRKFIRAVKNSGKHVVFVAHETEKVDGDVLIREPKLAANLSGELVDLCDVVGHLRIDKSGARVLRVQPEEKYRAKDRYDAFKNVIEKPDVSKMVAAIHVAYDKPPFENKLT